MKKCVLCCDIKSLTDFYKDRSRPDGLSNRCRTCDKQKAKSYAQTSNGKCTQKRYRQSIRGRLAKQKDDRKYRETKNGRKHIYVSIDKYKKTEKGRAVNQQVTRRRRERQYNLDMKLTRKDINSIYERFKGQCFYCHSKQRLEIDHHNPLSGGHGLSLGNAVLLCRLCNATKHTKKPEDFYSLDQLKQLEVLLQL
jgi:hypothetical protein